MRRIITFLVLLSGCAGLSWELLWQHHAALALGVSAQATAVVLACTMAGMALGATLMGRWLSGRQIDSPIRIYALLEMVIGLSGLALSAGFSLLAYFDVAIFRSSPALHPLVQGTGIALLLGPPTMAMGATIPVFVLLARQYRIPISVLYAINTAGAAAGVLLAAFAILPHLGVHLTEMVAIAINFGVAIASYFLLRSVDSAGLENTGARKLAPQARTLSIGLARLVAFSTGLITFGLEVAWFRSLRAAFQSTSDSFAIILAAVLVPLAIGARLALRMPRRKETVVFLLAIAGALILGATPIIERFDTMDMVRNSYWAMMGVRLGYALAVLGLPMLVLGIILPWLLEEHQETGETGRLYALNTGGAVVGSLATAWLLLPALGFAWTAWAFGSMAVALSVVVGRKRALKLLPIGLAALALAMVFETGVGRLRVQGAHLRGEHTVLDSREGPDATVSVIEHPGGVRELVIDGFQASGEARTGHYMMWMGHLPMLLHEAPKQALVICFGTGQTANAVRRENPDRLHIAELSDAVLSLAPYFPVNEGVLEDKRTTATIMDGRALLRRSEQKYDVLTLEPMAPHFAGTNALYSVEFYRLAAARMNPGGVVAQWLPFHLTSDFDALSIARTFIEVFPESWLWVDPVDKTGILVGRVATGQNSLALPGLARPGKRDLDDATIRAGFRLRPDQLKVYASRGHVISDDNQLLSYGPGRRRRWSFASTHAVHIRNLEHVEHVAKTVP